MGIPRGVARLLLDEHKRRPFSGSLLELGRMSVFFGPAELERWAREQGATLASGVEPGLSHDLDLAAQGCLGDRSFFKLLGFDDVRCCDISKEESPDYVLDLNQPVPGELHGQFDVVLESGTIQHVYHLPQVLENIHRLLRVGGRVIHGMLPSTNHVDHGYYMYSPSLFHDFYASNGWRVEQALVMEYRPFFFRARFHSRPWRIYRYTPGCLDHLSYGGFGNAQVGIFLIATRCEGATADQPPQQDYWKAPMLGGARRRGPGRASLGTRLELRCAAHPWLHHLMLAWKAVRAAVKRRLPRRMPALVARY